MTEIVYASAATLAILDNNFSQKTEKKKTKNAGLNTATKTIIAHKLIYLS